MIFLCFLLINVSNIVIKITLGRTILKSEKFRMISGAVFHVSLIPICKIDVVCFRDSVWRRCGI